MTTTIELPFQEFTAPDFEVIESPRPSGKKIPTNKSIVHDDWWERHHGKDSYFGQCSPGHIFAVDAVPGVVYRVGYTGPKIKIVRTTHDDGVPRYFGTDVYHEHEGAITIAATTMLVSCDDQREFSSVRDEERRTKLDALKDKRPPASLHYGKKERAACGNFRAAAENIASLETFNARVRKEKDLVVCRKCFKKSQTEAAK